MVENATMIPTVQSSESLTSVTSDSVPVSGLASSQIGRKIVGKTMGNDLAMKEERVMVPLGENRGNIPVPRKTRK